MTLAMSSKIIIQKPTKSHQGLKFPNQLEVCIFQSSNDEMGIPKTDSKPKMLSNLYLTGGSKRAGSN